MKKNEEGFSVIEAGLIIIILGLLVGVGWYVWSTKNGSKAATVTTETQQNNTDTSLLTFKSVDTKNWKKGSHTFAPLDKPVTYSYPADWIISVVEQSGHPNYATLTGPDNSSCIKFSLSSGSDKFDEALKDVLNNWDASHPDPVTEASATNSTTKIIRVQKDSKTTLAAAVNLGKDVRFSENTVHALLTTCGANESDIFNAVVKSINAN